MLVDCESRAQYLKICKILADIKLEINFKFKDGILAVWNSKIKHKSGQF